MPFTGGGAYAVCGGRCLSGSAPGASRVCKGGGAPVVVPKRMHTAHFEPHLSRSHPLSSAYLICGVVEVSWTMFLPPPAGSQYSILVRVRARVRARVRLKASGGGRGRVRTRLRVGVGVRVRVGFKDSVGVQSGQIFPLDGFGAHGASSAFGAHEPQTAAPLATNCWPAPRRGGGGRAGGGGGAGVVGVLGPAESPPPGAPNRTRKKPKPYWGGGGIKNGSNGGGGGNGTDWVFFGKKKMVQIRFSFGKRVGGSVRIGAKAGGGGMVTKMGQGCFW